MLSFDELHNINTLNLMGTSAQDRQAALAVISSLSMYYNTFGNYESLTQKLFEALNDDGRKNMEVIFVIMGYSLAREREKLITDGGWDDDRVKNSRELAYENYMVFTECYQKMFSSQSITVLPSLSAARIIYAELRNEHPTIRQAMFGGMYRYLIESENKSSTFADMDFSKDHGFPLI